MPILTPEQESREEIDQIRDRGGMIAARQLFSEELTTLLVELNEELAI